MFFIGLSSVNKWLGSFFFTINDMVNLDFQNLILKLMDHKVVFELY